MFNATSEGRHMHPFTRTGLGQAPFRCVGVSKKAYQACQGAPIQAAGSCAHCGTCIMYCYHIVSADGREFVVGCDCVMKTGGESHVAGFRQQRLQLAREQRAEKREATYKARKEKWAAEAADKRAAFEAAHPEFCAKLAAAAETNSFARDLQGKLIGWGSLSDAQMAALERGWARDAQRAAEEAAAEPVPVTAERVEVEGEIVSTREQAGYFEGQTVLKMLVKTSRGFKLWGSVPRDLMADDSLVGKRVAFAAKIERSKDDDKFGFFSRPTKARFVTQITEPKATAA